jgi:phosphoribosylcarboxyaminoimidazole (NCAIR) mutase
MPSGVTPAVVLDPAGAAQFAAKILAVSDGELRARIVAAQRAQTDVVIAADIEMAGQE